MTDYSFDVLNDKEFEILVVDLLSEVLSVRVERFKSGRDRGIDGRFFDKESDECIIQCKHYLASGYTKLIYQLKNEEVDKVKKLAPKKYFFATSLPLAQSQKEEIKSIFEPYINSENDIFGKEDLNDLLKKYSKIEENHYKLWLSSTTVLQRILNNEVKGRSKTTLEETRKKLRLYVETDSHKNAIELLDKSHILIISGEPGIGKSTMSENICYFHFYQGYEFCEVMSINEAEKVFDEDKKQIFYFDDFLGGIFLLAIEDNKDNQLTRFMQRVKNDKNKRFILTSRTHILNQGFYLSDAFKSKSLKKDEFLLTVENLSQMDKAYILYNHIWFSSLSEEYIEEIYKDKRYKDIIMHKNFNPRIIEYITDNERISDYKADEYWQYIIDTLNNPADVWAHAFNVQSDDFIRNLVLLTVCNGNRIKESDLRQAFNKIISFLNLQVNSSVSRNFDEYIQLTMKIFLNRLLPYDSRVEYTLFNPSIADYVLKRYKWEAKHLSYIFQSLESIESIRQLKSLYKNELIDKNTYIMIIKDLFKNINISSMNRASQRYYLHLIAYFKEIDFPDLINSKKLIEYINYIFKKEYIYSIDENTIEVILSLVKSKQFVLTEEILLFMIEHVEKETDDINELILFINEIGLDTWAEDTYAKIINDLNEKISDYLEGALDDLKYDIDLHEFLEGYDEDTGIEMDEYGIEQAFSDELDRLISELEAFDDIEIDKSHTLSSISIDDLIDGFTPEVYDDQDDDRWRGGSSSSIDSIDELFAR